ncbi:MAG: large conductance mechanosensitive channel protein MscL [Ruaniaceae bacterium]|nr:large conductance mechanosensitive channel protein MscL [Ruaniaceae bacterium]
MLQGFKDFIARGNAIEMAVGIVIGAAFGGVVNAAVDSFINPLIGGLFGQPNFDNVLSFTVGDAVVMPGAILTALVNFLLVALAVYFLIVVPMNKLAELRVSDKEEVVEEIEANTQLLTEIRDLLARR